MNVKHRINRKILFITVGILVAITVFLISFFICQNQNTEVVENSTKPEDIEKVDTTEEPAPGPQPIATDLPPTEISDCTQNFTTDWQYLMLINPNFTVSTDWIANRKTQLIDISATYGIEEGLAGNGQPLLDAIAAEHLNEMAQDYKTAYPGHELTTRSCFRSVGTNCGRLCYATGTSDHHSGYTCDLIDDYYGESLDTDLYSQHPEWQWLHENSYKYGFIDRFIEHWAGGSMNEPVNVDANGTTGLYETWHYRYVGLTAAEEIATGKYNSGVYDSLEHYLKATGRITNLLSPSENCYLSS